MRAIEAIFRISLSLLFLFFIVMSLSPVAAQGDEVPDEIGVGTPPENASVTVETATTQAATQAAEATGVEEDTGAKSVISIPSADSYVFTGAAQSAIPIIVAPGRGGIVPSLALRYNSYRGNTWLGIGWDLDLGAIQRSTKHGVNYSANDYVLVKDGSHTELVPRSEWGTGTYGGKIEGEFTKYKFNGATAGWEVTARDGTTYYYGQTAASRQDSALGVFKWCLDRVEDVHGNYLTVTYTKDQGEIYLDRIDYTGNTHGLSPTNYVRFYLEDRPDPQIMYTTNAQVKTVKRLKTIEVNAGGSRTRAYKLIYSVSQTTSRSLLTTIEQFGTDATIDASGTVTGGTALPPITAAYSSNGDGTFDPPVHTALGSANYSGWILTYADVNGDGKADAVAYLLGAGAKVQVGLSNEDGTFAPFVETQLSTSAYTYWQITFVDVNGDGKQDAVAYYFIGAGVYTDVALSNGDGTFAPFVRTTLSASGYGCTSDACWKLTFADVNGDGKTDAVAYFIGGAGVYTHVALAQGDGHFAPFVGSTLAPNATGHWDFAFVDVNGDGKADAVLRNIQDEDDQGIIVYVFLSRGDGTYGYYTSAAHTVLAARGQYGCYGCNNNNNRCCFTLTFADVNGDGKADAVASYMGDQTQASVALAKGDGFFAPFVVSYPGGASYTYWRYYFADVNSDGQADAVGYFFANIGGTYTRTALAKGDATFTSFAGTTITSGNYCPSGQHCHMEMADINGDGKMDVVLSSFGVNGIYSDVVLAKGPASNLMTSLANGRGATTSFEYTPSSSYQNTMLPFIVHPVSRITVDDGGGHQSSVNYTYQGGLYDFATREFRGFEKVVATDEVTGLVTETHYHQEQFFQGRVAWSQTRDSGSALVERLDNTWETRDLGNGSAFPYLTQGIATKYDDAGSSLGSITMHYTYDDYGSILTELKTTTDSYSRFIESTYNNDTTNWILGKPTNVKIRKTSGSAVLRETRMQYDALGRLIAKKLVHSGVEHTTSYGYDSYGNVTTVTNPRNAQTITDYDTYAIFPVKTTNALGHEVNKTFDPRFGTVLTETNANGQTTTYTYDCFGRQTHAGYPDGSTTNTTYHIEPGNHYTIVQSSNAPDAITFFDNLGRTIEEQTRASDGTIIAIATQYDNAGRISAKSLPMFSGQPGDYTTFEYDLRSRLIRQTKPDATYRRIQYNGLQQIAIDENDHSKTITKDLLGRIKRVDEPIGGHAEYQYDCFDNLVWVKDPIGNETDITYDDLGRKIAMDDPYMGHWAYNYDATDNLVWQKNGRNQEVQLQYDPLNRPVQKDYLATSRQIIYTYDEELSNYYNIGSLTSVAVTSESPQIITQYNYDKMGRQTLEKRIIDTVEYAFTRHYDLAGRLDYIIYPDGNRFDYAYHPIGHLKTVKVHSNSYQLALYTNYNALGDIGSIAFGNGAVSTYQYWAKTYRPATMVTQDSAHNVIQDLTYTLYDNVGNIITIIDNHNAVTHGFAYDAVNRLTHAQASAADPTRAYEQAYTYDLAGNILQQTGTNAFQVLDQDSVGRPTRIDYAPEIADIGQRHIDYNQDDMPTRIVFRGKETTIIYDGEDTRVKKVAGTSNVIYAGGLYEVRDGAPMLHVFAAGRRIATLEGQGIVHYYHTDHLNSTTVVTDTNGQAVEEMGYLPFGALLYDNVVQGGQWQSVFRFTGQEYDSEYALYNYNARLYDPIMGRFISPDHVMQDYYDPQSLNRYSYTRNNPLTYVDPTGNQYETYEPDLWRNSVYYSFNPFQPFGQNMGKPYDSGVAFFQSVLPAQSIPSVNGPIYSNPPVTVVINRIESLAKANKLPLASLMALVDLESSFEQFEDGKIKYGYDPETGKYTSNAGLTMIGRYTARDQLNADYARIQTDWEYNLEKGVELFGRYYSAQKAWNRSEREVCRRAYFYYHEGPNKKGKITGEFLKDYLKRYDKYWR